MNNKIIFLFSFLIFIPLLGVTQADFTSVKASAIIDLGDSPDSTIVKVSFDRTTSEGPALLVTSLNLSHKDSPKRMDQLKVTPISNYLSLLTGWFVVQQESQELWVGITLPAGENHGEIELVVPGMLKLVSDYPEIYELSYQPSGPMLSQLAGSAQGAQHARMESIRLSLPSWGEIIKEKSTGWKRVRSNYYTPENKEGMLSILTVKSNPGTFSIWMKGSMVHYFSAMAFGVIAVGVLFGPQAHLTKKHRYLSLGIVMVGFTLLIFLGGGFPPNLKKIIFDGDYILGFISPFVLVAVFPLGWSETIKEFFHEVRNAT
ncbi:hypothetical protein PJI16_19925 [Nitrospira sp. MA-1]|nr:hypothetical protein [Nitrospira sp. MA-1]